jgi:hypothetical protein
VFVSTLNKTFQMKTSLKILLVPALALSLAGCSTIDSRIREHSTEFSQLDPDSQALIKQGEVGIGFTTDMVYMALGAPDAKRQHLTNDGRTETWIYATYYDDYMGSAFVGYHRWYRFDPIGRRYHFFWGPDIAYTYNAHRDEKIRVAFRDGKVISIDQKLPS